MAQFPISENTIILFTAVFLRILGILMWLPIFGDNRVPALLKIAFSAMLSFLLFPVLSFKGFTITTEPSSLIWLLGKEASIGLVLGFISKISFHGVMMAAQFVGFQMGFGAANMFDPSSESTVSELSQFQNIIAIIVFLIFNFHHFFITSLGDSFKLIPLGLVQPSGDLVQLLIKLTADIFVIGVKLSAPVLTALIFTMFALGMVARAVPQVQVFVLSFPISFLVGFLVFIVSMSFFTRELANYFNQSSAHFLMTMKLLGR